MFSYFCSSCLGTRNAVFTKVEWISWAEEAVLTGQVYSWKKKNAQCKFCSLTDFGGKSAENKVASVQLPQRGFLVAPQVFIKLLCKKGDIRVTSHVGLKGSWPSLSVCKRMCEEPWGQKAPPESVGKETWWELHTVVFKADQLPGTRHMFESLHTTPCTRH